MYVYMSFCSKYVHVYIRMYVCTYVLYMMLRSCYTYVCMTVCAYMLCVKYMYVQYVPSRNSELLFVSFTFIDDCTQFLAAVTYIHTYVQYVVAQKSFMCVHSWNHMNFNSLNT